MATDRLYEVITDKRVRLFKTRPKICAMCDKNIKGGEVARELIFIMFNEKIKEYQHLNCIHLSDIQEENTND